MSTSPFEKELLAVLQQLVQHPSSRQGPTEDQLDLEIRFRALRNALGNFGRRGTSDVALLRSPSLRDGQLTFATGTLPKTGSIVVLKRDGTSDTYGMDKLTGGSPPTLPVKADVVGVRIDDEAGNPVKFGVPHRI